MFVPISPPPPSPQAEELGEQLALFVAEYREDNPDVSPVDVERAFLVARDQLRRTTGGAPAPLKTAMIVATVIAITASAGVFVLLMNSRAGGSGGGGGGGAIASQPLLLIAMASVGVILVLALIVIVVRTNR